jgi:hypothetical protein
MSPELRAHAADGQDDENKNWGAVGELRAAFTIRSVSRSTALSIGSVKSGAQGAPCAKENSEEPLRHQRSGSPWSH